MEVLLLHLLGDYILQNDWQAQNKTKPTAVGYLACFIHATLYSLPYLWIASLNAWLVIFISHFLIDKYRLAVWLIRLTNWNWSAPNFGYSESKPVWMAFWLMVIIDNTIHLFCNYYAIMHL